MGVSVRWYDDTQQIIFFQFTGRWTWDEYRIAYAEIIQLMDSVDHKIDFIVDMFETDHYPPGILMEIKKAADYDHPNMGLGVWIGVPTTYKTIGDLFTRLFPGSAAKYPFAFAESKEEAERKIAKNRQERGEHSI